MNIDNVGFVILCPEKNLGGLKATVRSIRSFHGDKPHFCILGKNATPTEVAEFNIVCPTVQAGSNHSSMLNRGFKSSKTDWSIVFMAGQLARSGLFDRYEHFCTSEKEVLFQVIGRKWAFHEGSIHGMMLHRKAMKEIGKLDEAEEDFEIAKLLWASRAIDLGYQFRALVGVPR